MVKETWLDVDHDGFDQVLPIHHLSNVSTEARVVSFVSLLLDGVCGFCLLGFLATCWFEVVVIDGVDTDS
jgi:hypothetical protein